jgi:hypothetical protein
MASFKKEKLSDLQEKAMENISFATQSVDIIKQYITKGIKNLKDITDAKDFFTIIAFLNAQQKAPKIEDFIRKKLQHNPVKKKEERGDAEKDGIYYEYKISTTNEDEQINALQIRLFHKVDCYLLGYIDEKQFELSRLYLITKDKMEELCKQYDTATHGTKTTNASNENVEKSIRIKMKPDNPLLEFFDKNYRALDLENIIFN